MLRCVRQRLSRVMCYCLVPRLGSGAKKAAAKHSPSVRPLPSAADRGTSSTLTGPPEPSSTRHLIVILTINEMFLNDLFSLHCSPVSSYFPGALMLGQGTLKSTQRCPLFPNTIFFYYFMDGCLCDVAFLEILAS